MKAVPYSVAIDPDRDDFDLVDLGPTRFRGFATGFLYDDGHMEGGEVLSSAVTVADYDEKFIAKLLELGPPQRARDMLQHHLDQSIRHHGNEMVFLDHFECVILYALEQHYQNLPVTKVCRTWFDKTMDNIHKQHRRERDHFLSKAYEQAVTDAPEDPLSVTRDPIDFGSSLGFDEATTTRIMLNLVDEGLVMSSLGLGMLMITAKGRRYLEQLHGDDDPRLNPPVIINNITADNSSTVQVANSSTHVKQTATRGDGIQEARMFADRLGMALPEIQKVAPAEQFAELKDELEFLKRKLDSPAPPRSVIKTIKDELLKRVIGLPFDAAKWLGPEMIQGLS